MDYFQRVVDVALHHQMDYFQLDAHLVVEVLASQMVMQMDYFLPVLHLQLVVLEYLFAKLVKMVLDARQVLVLLLLTLQDLHQVRPLILLLILNQVFLQLPVFSQQLS